MDAAGLEDVTDEDIRIWRSTLLARRFPGLKSMPTEDIKAMIVADRKAHGRKVAHENKTYPKSHPPPAPATPEPGLIWSPVSAGGAKEEVARQTDELYLSKGTLYAADRMDYLADQASDMSKRGASGAWLPSNAGLQSKEATRVDCYLSPSSLGTAEKALALSEIRRRAGANMSEYSLHASTRRGQTLV
ncbi:hypothetical protein FOA52_003171 [Chlamydomonas sp. UWO 241]|nr:hypothetical protein FOA52_003171 [Chlamydomonas sp. UWO 241]